MVRYRQDRSLFTSGIAIYDDKILVRCCKWSKFHTLIVDRSKIIKVELEQTIFQKIGKRCSVSLWFEGEKHIKYKVKAFDEQKALDIAELLGYDASELRYTMSKHMNQWVLGAAFSIHF